jgi:hypothetical protein
VTPEQRARFQRRMHHLAGMGARPIRNGSDRDKELVRLLAILQPGRPQPASVRNSTDCQPRRRPTAYTTSGGWRSLAP